MADIERVKADIAAIADSPRNATLSDIERIVNQLKALGYAVNIRNARHGRLFAISDKSKSLTARFMVNYHNPGNKQAMIYSIRDFVIGMSDLELL